MENAVIHGFDGIERKAVLAIEIQLQGENGLRIEISDNGKGIPEETAARYNRGDFPDTEGRSHIGMKNAMERIRMYYGEDSEVRIVSRENEYTKVIIQIKDTAGGQE